MTMTTPPTNPSNSGSEDNFNSNSINFFGWADGIPGEINPFITGNVSMTSTTSLTIGTGAKSPVLATDTTFSKGQFIFINSTATPTKWMAGYITNYVSGTKTISVTITLTSGDTDTLASWRVTVGAPPIRLGTNGYSDRIQLIDGNGAGSTNTMIRRFATQVINIGTAITYADSAADGASFTANIPGLYAIHYRDAFGSGVAHYAGLTLNSAQLTTAITSVTASTRYGLFYMVANAVPRGASAVMLYLNAGDVIRPHLDAATGWKDTAGDFVGFEIARVTI